MFFAATTFNTLLDIFIWLEFLYLCISSYLSNDVGWVEIIFYVVFTHKKIGI